MIQWVLVSIAVLTLPNLISMILASRNPNPIQQAALEIFFLIYLLLVCMIFLRRMDYRLKSWVLFFFIYISGVIAFARGGLIGIGRDYLLVLPLVGIILMGTWTGIVLALVSIVTVLGMGFVANAGLLAPYLIYTENPVSLPSWMLEGTYLVAVMVFVVLLSILFSRFQLSNLIRENRTGNELAKARDDLERINQDLEKIVDERTVQLTIALEEAEKAKAQAEETSRAKSVFLAGISHEIRTPMNGLVGVVGLLSSTSLDSRQRGYVEIMRSSSETLLAIINDFLDLSKIEADGIRLEKEPFDLIKCVDGLVEVWGLRASEKNVEMSYKIGLDVPTTLVGDNIRLKQILANLLNNACKFTDSGEIQLEVRLVDAVEVQQFQVSQESKDKTWLKFSVRDTGIGINPDNISEIFTAYNQGDTSTARVYGGTGLGLVISREISELMGGFLWVESQGIDGQGSVFYCLLPFQPSPSPMYSEFLAELDKPLLGKRIAWVSSIAFLDDIIQEYQSALDDLFHIYRSAEEALDELHNGARWDAILFDQSNGGMHYIQFAEQAIKSIGRKVPMLLLIRPHTTLNLETYRYYAQTIEKPIRWSRLLKYLAAGLNQTGYIQEKHIQKIASKIDPGFSKKHPLEILIVEDNPVNQQVLQIMLEQLGYKPQIAANGNEALAKTSQQHFQIIFMDKQMPEMDGIETAQRILETGTEQTRPDIILVTAHNERETAQEAVEHGFADVLFKPIRIQDVSQVLARSYWTLIKSREASPAAVKNAVIEKPQAFSTEYNGPIDQKMFEEFWDPAWTKPEDIRRIVKIFISESIVQMDDLQNEIGVENYQKVRRIVHSLKGSSVSVGGRKFSELCQYLENRSNEEIQEAGMVVYKEIQLEYNMLIAALKKMIEQ